MTLASLTGLGPEMAEVRAGFAAALAATTTAAWRELERTRTLRPGATPPTLEIPTGFADVLAAAIAHDARSPAPSPGGAADLRTHYLTTMPRMRVEQLATTAEPQHTLFHSPLDWSRLPRLSRAIDQLYAELGAAGAADALGPPSGDAFRAAHATLGHLYEHTYYGGFMPLLYGYPADLAALARALRDAPLHQVVDHWLTAPFMHELSHLGRARSALLPPYLDECIAGYLGVKAWPAFAFPAPGEDNALFATPWFAQVGQGLARAVGWVPLLRAHAGVIPWHAALPAPLIDALARIGWAEHLRTRAPHFLADTRRPAPWLKLIFLGAAGRPLDGLGLAELDAVSWADIPTGPETPDDAAILDDALRAMCVDNRQVDHTYRVGRRTPPLITVDLAACQVSAPPGAGGHDPAVLSHLFPPATAARLRAAGVTGFDVTLPDSSDASRDAAAAAILSSTPSDSVRPRGSS